MSVRPCTSMLTRSQCPPTPVSGAANRSIPAGNRAGTTAQTTPEVQRVGHRLAGFPRCAGIFRPAHSQEKITGNGTLATRCGDLPPAARESTMLGTRLEVINHEAFGSVRRSSSLRGIDADFRVFSHGSRSRGHGDRRCFGTGRQLGNERIRRVGFQHTPGERSGLWRLDAVLAATGGPARLRERWQGIRLHSYFQLPVRSVARVPRHHRRRLDFRHQLPSPLRAVHGQR